MISLHAIWWQSRLHLWGEDSARGHLPAPGPAVELPSSTSMTDGASGWPPAPHLLNTTPAAPDARRDRRIAATVPGPATRDVKEHPAALTTFDLHAAVGEVSPDGLLASIADESSLDLWLPCVGGVPAVSEKSKTQKVKRSDDMVDEECAEGARLERATVPTLAFTAADSIDLLVSIARSRLETSSDSVRLWGRLARYVVSLLARQQFVPTMESRADGTYAAKWQLFVRSRQELGWLEAIAKALPPVCRAVVTADRHAVEPTRIVDSFLLEAGDAVIRRILANDPFFSQIRARAAKEKKPELNWLAGLVGEARTIRGSAEDNAAFAARVRSWIGQLEDDAEDTPPELSFSLIEPDGPAEAGRARWQVRFHLRSSGGGDPLEVDKLWSGQEETTSILGRRLTNRGQHLKSELARAAEVFPALKDALAAGAPTGVALTTHGAHTFLCEWGPMLRAQGFGVLLPAWAQPSEHPLGLELVVRPNEDGVGDDPVAITTCGLGSMLVFDWRVAIGDQRLSHDEFEAIAAEPAPLVHIRGTWVDIDHEAAQRALVFIRRQGNGRITLAEAIRLASGAEEIDAGLPIVALRGTSWIEALLANAPDPRVESVRQPLDFRGTLRPYQRTGLAWLAFLDRLGIGACLADDMGLGKTIQLIALLLHERSEGPAVGPTLLFAPMSVVGNWAREIERFAPSLRVLVHHGPDRLCGTAFTDAAARHDIVITTYGLALRDLTGLRRIDWHRIALDEAQKIKNPSANQTIAIRSLPSRHRVALTGTPIENHLSELWSIMEMLNPGLLGGAATFRKRFAVPIEKLGDQGRAEQLRRMIRPFTLRRLKSDPNVACDLPEKMEMRVYCNLTPEQAAHYERTVNTLLSEVEATDGIRRRGMILATLTRLKQVCNHPSHLLRDGGPLDGRSGKCERLVEMLEEVLAEGDAALVFTQFRKMGDLLQRLLMDRLRTGIPFLHGGSTAKARDRMVRDFQDPAGSTGVFLLSLKAGGFGLNLTKANHVFHFDRWWNPAVEAQATDRAHRIGQTRRVQVHKFVCIGTIEDRIDQLLSEKAALADRIVGSGDDWLTGLSTAELRDYLTLSSEAIAET